MQHEHRVRDRDVFEEVGSLLERLEHRLDRDSVALAVGGRERHDRACDRLWEVVATEQRRRGRVCLGIVAQHEQRERRCVPADRRLGVLRAGFECPPRGGRRIVSCEQQGFHRSDRASPRIRRCVLPAVSVPLGRATQPLARLVMPAVHQEREPGGPRRIPELRELALVGFARLTAAVARNRSLGSLPPGHPRIVHLMRQAREVLFVDGVRTPFGKAGPKGQFWRTRADDMGVKAVRELLRRNPEIPPDRIGDVVLAATAQVGDQGLTLGRDVALLAGIPHTVPGFAVDRMCAGALTAVTAAAGEIALGAADIALAGGIEHMGHHPMGADVDFNPRFVSERLIDESAASMGQTAENLHDLFPAITKERADAFALQSQQRAAAAWTNGVMKETVVPMAVFTDDGWKVADRDEFLRPETSLDGLAALKPAFRAGGRVTAGNSAGLTDGATAAFLAAEDTAEELGLKPKLRLVGYAYAGVEPHLMGYGPVPATRRVLEQAGVALDAVDLFELNEPFAVQVLTWCDELGISADDPRLNPYGGAIACGHPLAATGVRLISQLAYGLRERGGRYGLTALCIGMGMGCAILWENLQ